MVKKINIAIVGLILTIAFPNATHGQQQGRYPVLKKYRKLGFIVGPALYDKGVLEPQYGNYSFENHRMPGFNAGLEYNFFPDRRLSLVTGLFFALEPVFKASYKIDRYDLFPEFKDDLTNKTTMYGFYSISSPVLLQLNIQTSNKIYLSFFSGLKAMYFPEGEAEMIQAISSEELSEHREIFGIKAESPEKQYFVSFVMGVGGAYALKNILLTTRLLYVLNFKNTISGEYLYSNLLTSPDSRGDYKLSGNYFGLLFTIRLKKHCIKESIIRWAEKNS